MLKQLVSGTVTKFLKTDQFTLLSPKNPNFGDYAIHKKQISNVSGFMLQVSGNPLFSKVEEKAGFINFFFSKKALIEEMNKIFEQKDNYGQSEMNKGKRIMIEFTDPNPFKEFHIGHLYSNIIGETIARLFEATGATVKRANYQGDVGMHVAKCLWAYMEKSSSSVIPRSGATRNLAKRNLRPAFGGTRSLTSFGMTGKAEQKIKFLQRCYQEGTKAYETDPQAKKEIETLNRQIYQALNEKTAEVKTLWRELRQWSLDYFETIYQRLGTKFDFYYFESAVGEIGLKIVKEFLKKGIFEKSQGAVIFPGEKYGLHNRVFINSLGLPTYEAKELGLAPTKYQDFPYDLSLIVTGNEIKEYFKVLILALKKIYPQLGEKTLHLAHGMVKIGKEKISSRTGTILTAEQLIEAVKKLAINVILGSGATPESDSGQARMTNNKTAAVKSRPENTSQVKTVDEVAEAVALSAIKYALLKGNIGRDVFFDMEKSVSLFGDSGPYLQYTYARCQSILTKGRFVGGAPGRDPDSAQQTVPGEAELSLLRSFFRFPETVEEAAKNFSPHLICHYLFDLAQKFNLFYEKLPILKAEKEQKAFRLALTQATAQLLKNGLSLLGIKTVEKI